MSTGSNGIRLVRRKPTSATATRNDHIATMYRSGKTLKATGAAFGLTRERVRQILKKLGIPSRRGVPLSRAPGDKVAHLYERGKNRTFTTSVQRALDRLGIARRGRATRVQRP